MQILSTYVDSVFKRPGFVGIELSIDSGFHSDNADGNNRRFEKGFRTCADLRNDHQCLCCKRPENDPVVAQLMNAPVGTPSTAQAQPANQPQPVPIHSDTAGNAGYTNANPTNATSEEEQYRQAQREERQQQIQAGATVAGKVLNGGGLTPFINSLPATSERYPPSDSSDQAKQQKHQKYEVV